MARRDGALVAGITAYADGPDEMREVINEHVKIGVDSIKLSMSGEEVQCSTLCRHGQVLTNYRSQRSGQRKTAISQTRRRRLASTRPTN